MQLYLDLYTIWGRFGFDVDDKAKGACRGCSNLVKYHYKQIVANDEIFAANDVAVAA